MTTLIERTKYAFGDMADAILDSGAVFPVNKAKAPALGRGVSWKPYTDPAAKYGSYWGLAVKTGDQSGITVIDFDTKDASPAGGNVLTLRGSHVWVPSLHTDRNSSNAQTKVDVRGNDGYAVFYSPNHQVINKDLNLREDYISYLLTTTRDKKEEVKENGVHFERVETNWYLKEVEAHGYEVDVNWVCNLLTSQVASAEEGSRNSMFYKSMTQIISLGADESQVKKMIDAAYESGLEGGEVMKTFQSAKRHGGIYPKMHMASKWAEHARAEVKSPVIEELVRLVTEQHNMAPLVSIKKLVDESGIPESTVKRHLAKMTALGLLHKKVNAGRQANGLSHANNFKLVMKGN